MIQTQLLEEALTYIDLYWNKIIIKPKKHRIGRRLIDTVTMRFRQTNSKNYHVLEVPYACIFPNDKKFQYIFYWDSYFIFRGILDTKHEWVIPSMLENFIYLFKKYHIIPNFTHPEALGRSQPPFLTSMIFDAYDVLNRDGKITTKIKKLFRSKKKWLEDHMRVAQEEYQDVWMDSDTYNHCVKEFLLNRYGNRDVGYAQPSEQESGWDMTSRFYNRCNEFLPVDLNSYLYKYEKDFAKAAEMLGETGQEAEWLRVAESRKERMQIFWNEEKGFFYDYDYVHHQQSEFESLAGFVPMWAGIATPEQAQRMVQMIPKFETKYGLTITTQASLPPLVDLSTFSKPLMLTMESILEPKQWDYPNIWPPLEYMTVIGLLKYGFVQDAKRIMEKSLEGHLAAFQKHGAFLEKLDATTGDMPDIYWYPTQLGFGWTNAIFYRYTEILRDLASNSLESSRTHFYPQTLPFSH
ncbi:MAG TPA: trehalase family glycosidase [Candidatus Saccharimonadales bacterium]|nr:trehalase family glycosidase [Candidatus Saccharimonadales bacterium]